MHRGGNKKELSRDLTLQARASRFGVPRRKRDPGPGRCAGGQRYAIGGFPGCGRVAEVADRCPHLGNSCPGGSREWTVVTEVDEDRRTFPKPRAVRSIRIGGTKSFNNFDGIHGL